MEKNYTLRNLLFLICLHCTFLGFSQGDDIRSIVGEWSDPIPFDIVPAAVANLPDGRLITWSSKFEDDFGVGDGFTFTELFDPSAGPDGRAQGAKLSTIDHDMYAAGINNLPNGSILVSGGASSAKTSIYDYKTGLWSAADTLNVGRGNPGNVTLADGTAFTFGGSWSGVVGEDGEKVAEIWRSGTGWKTLSGLPSDLLYNANDLNLEDECVFRADNQAWLWPAPNGKIFHAGPGEDMHWIDPSGEGSFTDAGKRGNDNYSANGTTVMIDTGKILKIGGANSYNSGDSAKDDSYVIDFNDENNVMVTPTTIDNKLNYSRTMHNSVVLPNGNVFVTGGLSTSNISTDDGARFFSELYNARFNRWTSILSNEVPRAYNSVSILLPDGRVFVGGGGLCGTCTNQKSAQIYSPPYLLVSN